MRKKFTFVAAAALAMGSMTWVGHTWAQDTATPAADAAKSDANKAADATKDAANNAADATKNAADNTADATKNAADKTADATKDTGKTIGDKTADAAHKVGEEVKDAGKKIGVDLSTAGKIKDTLQDTTEAALTKGGFDDLVERLSDADRNRIGKDRFAEQKFDDLDGRIAQFQKDWKAKYNQDFNIKDKDAVFNDQFAQIEVGEMGTNAKLAADQQKNASEPTAEHKDNANGNDTGDKNLDKGRNIATVTIPASHDMPELKVPLIHEGALGKWKINVPDSVDGPKLKDNLLKHLTMADEMKDKWPADVNDAYRAVSHHVLEALLDADNQKAADTSGATGASDTITPAPATPAAPAAPANP